MAMLMSRIRTISLAFVVATVNLAAVAGTNAAVMAAAKCPQAISVNERVLVSDTAVSRELKAELKEYVVAAEAVYEKRYRDLKVAHDDFMCHVSVLVAILGIAAATIGIGGPILQWKYKGDIDKTKRRIDNLEKIATQFTMRRAKDSLAMMRFVWTEFLAQMQSCNGNVNGREIVHPLYRVAEVLWQACEIGDAHFLNESVNAIVKVIEGFRLVAQAGSTADNLFKTYVKKNRILTDSSNSYNLVQAMNGETPSSQTVLEFMNEFGITMFGEVRG